MAYPLEGPPVRLLMPDRPSSGTVTGAIQILPSGLPILLLADRQTTGGYPVAAVVISADLGHAAQLAPGDDVRFAAVSRTEAMRALLEQDVRRREEQ
jgi:allophanate hydrolase subunit 2